DRGGQLLDGFAAGGAADQGDAGGGGAGALLERRDAVGQGAQQTLHVRAGDVLAGRGGAHAGEGGAGVGPVGGALPVEVGQQGDAVGAWHARERQLRHLLVAHAEQGAAGVEDAGGVDRGGHRQEPAGGVGEAGDGAAGVVRPGGTHHRAHARGADGDGDVPLPLREAERGTHVVAGAGGDRGTVRGAGHDLLRRAGQARQLERAAQRELDQLGLPFLGGGGVVGGAGGVAAIGEGLSPAGEVAGDVVVRQQHARGTLRVLGLRVAHPAQLRGGEGGDHEAADLG